MLHGIGGRTIAEAKERMGHDEYLRWRQYRRLHGTLNLGLRIEHAAAVTSFAVNRSNGGTAELKAFLPNRVVPAANDADALDQALREWT